MATAFCKRSLYSFRNSFIFTQYRSGYIVLIPETPKDLPDENPLLRQESLPEFSSLTTEICENGINKHIQDFEVGTWALEESINKQLNENEPVNVISEVIEPLERLGMPLDNTWGLIKTLYFADQKLMPRNKYMNIHDRGRVTRGVKFNSLPIYKACKGALKSGENFTQEQERVIKKFVLEGSLNGLDLEGTKKEALYSSLNKIAIRRATFKEKFEASIKKFKHTITDNSLVRDFPTEFLRRIASDPAQPTRGPWTVTLLPHIYDQFLQYCPDRNLRWNVWTADIQKNSNLYDKTYSTSVELEEIRDDRHQQAITLGYKSYVHMSMSTKMAGSLDNVQNMLDNLLEKAKPAQELELHKLEQFAYERGFEGNIELWDLPYWRRKQQKSLFNFDEEALKDYFPLTQVLLGLFTLCEQLFGLKIEERKGAETWHPDVRFFRVIDEKTRSVLGGFYLDPYAREGKIRVHHDSGWMVGLRTRSKVYRSEPLAALIFNFTEPMYGKPSLLTFKDVDLLFRRFGHTLQHILTQTTFSEVSGLSNIEWDAVEICSNFMANWLYDRGTLESISGHFETNEPLPNELLENLSSLRHHMSGLDLCREIYLSNLDLQLHLTRDFWADIVEKIWPNHFLFSLYKYDYHPCSFKEIFAEEWGAAYYCHLWSKIVAADVYNAFVEAGVENQQELSAIGNRFKSTFLSLGGSCHPGEVFRRFRGRDPSPNALISDLGLKDIISPEPVLAI